MITADMPPPAWTSPNHYRVMVNVDARGVKRSKSPAKFRIDFTKHLRDRGVKAVFDENTIEVVAYDDDGRPAVYDSSRKDYEKHLLPWHVERYYGVDYVDLSFVMPDEKHTRYAVYFDTKESGLGKPQRYHGLVGDGDFFSLGYGRREVGAAHQDCFADLDGDGDLDLFRVTTEPFIYCYENVGNNRFVYRGKLTSGGEVFTLPMGENTHRSWATIKFHDWNGDGRQDLFVSICDGDDFGHVVVFENVTPPGGPIAFANRGRVLTETGKAIGDDWFAAVTIVDWDGDGKKDLLVGRKSGVEFFRNTGAADDVANIKLADGVKLDLKVVSEKMLVGPEVECVDLDGDGDLDLLISGQGAKLWFYENIGTRTNPVFKDPAPMETKGGGWHGACFADWDGDGLVDYVVGGLWELVGEPGEPRRYARLYKNVGTKTEPKFEERDANSGAPYTEQFQPADAARQNTVRAWKNGDKFDLIAGREGGRILWFRNIGSQLFPLFADAEEIITDSGRGPRTFVCDWNKDGNQDLLVTNWDGEVRLYINQGTNAEPKFGEAIMIEADGKPIKGTLWCSIMLCDWDNDGKRDLVMGMGGEGKGEVYPEWSRDTGDGKKNKGLLFFKNIGTDDEPVFARPEWILPGGKDIDYLRPNLGNYVDWDGDGKKDLIACEFEHNVRLYRNIGSGAAGEQPKFADADGQVIVAPWTVMRISGADVVDWHGDGDWDIITGQGHGGTYLRFYHRDYINDFVNNTFPIVTSGECEARR